MREGEEKREMFFPFIRLLPLQNLLDFLLAGDFLKVLCRPHTPETTKHDKTDTYTNSATG